MNTPKLQRLTMKSILSIFCVFIIGILDYGVLGAAGPPPPGDLKKNSDGSYDPYLISSLRTKREDLKNVAGGDVRSARQQRELYDPFYYYAPGIIRNRRNSHTYYSPYANYDRRRDVEYLYERNTQLDDASNNIFPDQPPARSVQTPVYQAYRNPNQFLTKQQIFGSQAGSNVVLARYYSPNAIDYRKPSYHGQNDNRFYGAAADRDRPAYNNHGRDQPGSSNEAWSVQVGTQLKVNDDGREKNPEQYYVRDEGRRGHSNQRRYSPYYRK